LTNRKKTGVLFFIKNQQGVALLPIVHIMGFIVNINGVKMFLENYLAGNEKEVWEAIERLKVSDLSKTQYDDIYAVCKETMRRVKVNTESIINALKKMGYDFSLFPDGEKHGFEAGLTKADPKHMEKISHLEKIAGTLPLTIKTFWETMGSICFIGFLKNWPEYSDQFFVASIDDNIETIEEWRSFRQECDDHADDPYILYISPNEDQKDNYDGEDYYSIELPCHTVDGSVNNAPSVVTFVDYLREAFECKGFPGLEKLPDELNELVLLKI
jgi:hypothetical protein